MTSVLSLPAIIATMALTGILNHQSCTSRAKVRAKTLLLNAQPVWIRLHFYGGWRRKINETNRLFGRAEFALWTDHMMRDSHHPAEQCPEGKTCLVFSKASLRIEGSQTLMLINQILTQNTSQWKVFKDFGSQLIIKRLCFFPKCTLQMSWKLCIVDSGCWIQPLDKKYSEIHNFSSFL